MPPARCRNSGASGPLCSPAQLQTGGACRPRWASPALRKPRTIVCRSGCASHHDLKANLLPEALAFLGPTVAKSATPLRRVRSGRAFTYEMLRAREVVPPLPAVTGGSFGRAFSVAAKMSGPQAPRQAARSWDRWQRTLVPAALVGTGGLLPGVRLSLDYCWALDKLLDEPDQSFAARVVGRYMLETTGKVTRRVHRSDPEIEQLYQQALECFTKSSDLALLGDVSLTGMSRVYHNEMTLDHYHGRFDRTLRSHSLDDCSGSAVRFAELLVTLGELKEGAAWARLAERLSAQAVDERGPVAALLAGLQSALSARDREAALEWGRQITDRVRAGSWAHSLPFRHRADEAALSGALTWMRLLLWPEQARALRICALADDSGEPDRSGSVELAGGGGRCGACARLPV